MSVSRIFIFFVCAAVIAGSSAAIGKNRGRQLAPEKSGQTIEPSRLTPVFFKGADCAGIASAFGDRTRYDGSLRPKFRYNGRHGGIDLSLEPGTPLLAMASGTLILKGAGAQMEGNFLWLLHTPEDTGLGWYAFTKYQHLDAVPEIEAGTRVKAGQVIARSGATGTFGGHYGKNGYPHLHLSVMKSGTGRFSIQGSRLVAKGLLVDPLLLFKNQGQGRVFIPVVSRDGRFHPKDARILWPVACGLE